MNLGELTGLLGLGMTVAAILVGWGSLRQQLLHLQATVDGLARTLESHDARIRGAESGLARLRGQVGTE